MSLISRSTQAVVLVAVGAFALSGCGGAPTPAETTALAAATSAAPSTMPSGAATPTPEPTPEAVDAAGGAACLVGDWLITQDALERFYTDVSASLGEVALSFTPVGTAGLRLGEDGTYTYTPDVTITQAMGEVNTVIKLSGTIDGTYVADAGTIQTDAVTTNGLVIQATVNDIALDPTAISEQITGAPIGNAIFECSADALTLTSFFADGSAVTPAFTELVRQ